MGQKFLPQDNLIGPGPTGVPKGPPSGFKPLTSVPQGINGIAKGFLNEEFGTMIPFTLEGIKYMARVEPHYHPPGYKGGPNGWHKGVTVYESGKSSPAKKVDRSKLYDQIDAFLAKFDTL